MPLTSTCTSPRRSACEIICLSKSLSSRIAVCLVCAIFASTSCVLSRSVLSNSFRVARQSEAFCDLLRSISLDVSCACARVVILSVSRTTLLASTPQVLVAVVRAVSTIVFRHSTSVSFAFATHCACLDSSSSCLMTAMPGACLPCCAVASSSSHRRALSHVDA